MVPVEADGSTQASSEMPAVGPSAAELGTRTVSSIPSRPAAELGSPVIAPGRPSVTPFM